MLMHSCIPFKEAPRFIRKICSVIFLPFAARIFYAETNIFNKQTSRPDVCFKLLDFKNRAILFWKGLKLKLLIEGNFFR